MKYLRSTTLGCEDIGITKSEFVAKTQFLSFFYRTYPSVFWYIGDGSVSRIPTKTRPLFYSGISEYSIVYPAYLDIPVIPVFWYIRE